MIEAWFGIRVLGNAAATAKETNFRTALCGSSECGLLPAFRPSKSPRKNFKGLSFFIQMCTYFFTCGQSHSHKIEGSKVWDKDSVLQVFATSENMARIKVCSLFGQKWSMCYSPDDISMEYYKNGICAVLNA